MSRWCSQPWCWVDPNECTGVAAPVGSSYFAHIGLTFSYETCNAVNVFSDFYAAIMAPRPPPPTAPPPPAAPPPYGYEAEIGLGTTGGTILLIIVIIAFQRRCLTHQLFLKQRKAAARDQIKSAIATTGHLRYTAAFLRASDFLKLGELKPHEELRNEGLLVYRDSYDELAHGVDYTIFISHQWTSFSVPDVTGKQYAVMCAAVRKIAEEKLPANAKSEAGGREAALLNLLPCIHVWVDYSSIPQHGSETTHLAIQSLASYSSLASEFVIVAPPVLHADTQLPCNFETYRRRTWCRAEQLCHLFRNGLDAMWLATSEDNVIRLSMPDRNLGSFKKISTDVEAEDWKSMSEEDWLSESIRVFQGDTTNEMDKLSLVMPILGLYAELYAYGKRSADIASPVTDVQDAGSSQFFASVLQICQQARDEIFPKTFRPAANQRKARELKQREMTRSSTGVIVDIDTESSTSPSKRPPQASNAPDAGTANGTPSTSFASPEPQRKSSVAEKGIAAGLNMNLRIVGKSGELELFGILVEETEAMINEDQELCATLANNVLKRRVNGMEKRTGLFRTAQNAARLTT